MKEDFMSRIKVELTNTFDEVYGWFDVPDERLYYIPQNGGWSIAQILEHIALTNHYLLILIRKGTIKALEKSRNVNYRDLLKDYELDWSKLELIGQPAAFKWHRPEHMEPGGVKPMGLVKADLQLQVKECMDLMDQMNQGEGILHKTMMTVNGLGKIDVYHYICFLVQHAKRHIVQMQQLEQE
ncbi:DinB family protein [Paraflavitalea speifideaquila]|uniref:DinB family protein n=1 Tax=Paraflavitalea speifideaquila TaxID=3076558 RepID=UPI0028E97C99|nr:DinB family protein [Paraflavitalea speifideiaquila]